MEIFSQEIIFFKSEPKKVANLKGLGTDMKKKYLLAFNRWFEINWSFN